MAFNILDIAYEAYAVVWPSDSYDILYKDEFNQRSQYEKAIGETHIRNFWVMFAAFVGLPNHCETGESLTAWRLFCNFIGWQENAQGWRLAFNFLKFIPSVLFNTLIVGLTIPRSILKIFTEFLPGFIGSILYKVSKEQEKKSGKETFLSVFPFFLSGIIFFIRLIGRAITSPIQGVKAAFWEGYNLGVSKDGTAVYVNGTLLHGGAVDVFTGMMFSIMSILISTIAYTFLLPIIATHIAAVAGIDLVTHVGPMLVHLLSKIAAFITYEAAINGFTLSVATLGFASVGFLCGILTIPLPVVSRLLIEPIKAWWFETYLAPLPPIPQPDELKDIPTNNPGKTPVAEDKSQPTKQDDLLKQQDQQQGQQSRETSEVSLDNPSSLFSPTNPNPITPVAKKEEVEVEVSLNESLESKGPKG